MGKVRVLPESLINQIAAGEVVERPASVVKELVENALDAEAKAITVRVEDGGKEKIQVSDDGCGMDPDDALLALERHATSKIRSVEDLMRLRTLGFRGEALPSIAAVSHLTLESASHPGEGTRVQVHFGRLQGQEPCSRPRGTTVTVGKLFSRTPARLKFLRSSATELRHIVGELEALAFAYPEVTFALWHGSRNLFHHTATGSRESRLFQLLGKKPPQPEIAQAGGFLAEIYLLPPTPAHRLVVAINRRVVKDRLLAAALAKSLRSVKGEWQADLFLHLQLPAQEVDFNVHPAKAEVRFANPSQVMGFLTQYLRSALEKRHGATPVRLSPALPNLAPQVQESASRYAFLTPERAGTGQNSLPPPLPPASDQTHGRYLGQLKNCYLLVETEEGLQLVDQHVAHERVLYEQLLARDATKASQALLIPEVLQLSAPLYALVVEENQGLAEAGVELEPLSGNAIRILALPAGVPVTQAGSLVFGLLQDLTGESLPGQSLKEKVAASLACRAAIKKNTPLSPLQAEQLLRDLWACQDPHRCPHGRPIVLSVPFGEIERRIGRRGG
ncbi:MAG: DNA mismatch repair endonuclease MutL [Thermoanaerobaculaceae bacterium]